MFVIEVLGHKICKIICVKRLLGSSGWVGVGVINFLSPILGRAGLEKISGETGGGRGA